MLNYFIIINNWNLFCKCWWFEL